MMTCAVVCLTLGDGHQTFNLLGERARLRLNSRRELLNGGGQFVDARQVQAAQERVVLTRFARQCLNQGGDLGSQPAPGHRRHDPRVVLPGDERGQHRPPGDAQDVGGDGRDLNPGVFELLLQPLGFPGAFDRERGAVPGSGHAGAGPVRAGRTRP